MCKKFNNKYNKINREIYKLLKDTYKEAGMEQERKILKLILRGGKVKPSQSILNFLNKLKGNTIDEKIEYAIENNINFFKVNNDTINILYNEAINPIMEAEKQILRSAEDKYRQIVFKSQMYAQTGATTTYNAIDMATKDFLQNGISTIRYKDGRNVNIRSYSEVCIRTAKKKTILVAEGEQRKEWGINLVQCSQYGACSKRCIEWQGRVYVDDVYSNGEPDGKHELLSTAIQGGLFHPNCRHTINPYIEGITKPVKILNKKDSVELSEEEQKQRYNERNIKKYKQLYNSALTEEDRKKYKEKVNEWTAKNRELIDNNDKLKRNRWRETVTK